MAEPPFEKIKIRESAKDRAYTLDNQDSTDPNVLPGYATTKAKAERQWRRQNPVESRVRTELGKSQRRLETAAGNAAERAARKGLQTVLRNPAGTVSAIGTGIAVGAATIVAAAAGYFLGDIARPEVQRLGREVKEQAVNQAYRSQVADVRRQLGRNPTAEELKPLSAAWRDAIARIKAGEPVSRARIW